MDQMLEGTAGAVSVMDDILIAAPTGQELDAILHRVIERATSYNLKLNLLLYICGKCHRRQPSVPYVITADGLKPDLAKVEAV